MSGFIHYSLRPKLALARQFIRDKVADVIIVWDLRRFSRNFVHSIMIFEEIKQAGGSVVSVSEPFADDSTYGQLFRALAAWFAESPEITGQKGSIAALSIDTATLLLLDYHWQLCAAAGFASSKIFTRVRS